MAKYHLKENGDPGVCDAKPGNCPKGSDEPHFSSVKEAREHYEKEQTVNDYKRIDLIRQEFGADSNVFRSWGEIHKDFKLSKEGKRYALAYGKGGTALVPWYGPKVLSVLEEVDDKAAEYDSFANMERTPAMTHYSMTINALDLNKLRIGDRFYNKQGEVFSVIVHQRGSFATVQKIGDDGKPNGSLGDDGSLVVSQNEGDISPDSLYKLVDMRPSKYNDGVAGFSESKAVKEMPASGSYEKVTEAYISYYDENDNISNIRLVSPLNGNLTKKRKIAIGEQLWAFTGKDPQRYRDADEETRLRWADSHLMTHKDYSWETKPDGFVSYNHSSGGGGNDSSKIKFLDL